MYKKILLATDGSSCAKKAENYAIEIAKKFGAQLTALYVVDISHWAMSLTHVMVRDTMEKELWQKGRQILADVKARAEKEDVKMMTKIREGEAWEEIIREAEETFCDAIVIGSRGLRGLSHTLLGSVADRVTRHAPCPVLVIR
ncbi:MAG: universal stress protein [Euryarchaeota archaeon]|nr:universal stress protein [Euryarchaeota archaeon]